ncbi:hypothetical protein AHAS_Ahas11G0239200 [Arachis hypogaea]
MLGVTSSICWVPPSSRISRRRMPTRSIYHYSRILIRSAITVGDQLVLRTFIDHCVVHHGMIVRRWMTYLICCLLGHGSVCRDLCSFPDNSLRRLTYRWPTRHFAHLKYFISSIKPVHNDVSYTLHVCLYPLSGKFRESKSSTLALVSLRTLPRKQLVQLIICCSDKHQDRKISSTL